MWNLFTEQFPSDWLSELVDLDENHLCFKNQTISILQLILCISLGYIIYSRYSRMSSTHLNLSTYICTISLQECIDEIMHNDWNLNALSSHKILS